MKKRAKLSIIFTLVIAIPLILIAATHLMEDSMVGTLDSAQTFFEANNTNFKMESVVYEGDNIDYFVSGNMTAPSSLVLFVHGAPGSWEAFKSYLVDPVLRKESMLISLSRPGYGFNSSGKPIVSISQQADVVLSILQKYTIDKIILVGHSFGGPIAAKLAADHPELIDGLLMIAPLIDPYNEPIKWYAHLCNIKWIDALLPSFIQVATAEKMAHPQELQLIEDDWQKIITPTIHYHGGTDALAPMEANIAFSKKHINPEYLFQFTDDEAGHLLVWDNEDQVKAFIMKLLNQNRSE